MALSRKVPAVRFCGFSGEWHTSGLENFVSFFGGLTYKPEDVRNSGTLVLRSSNVKNGEIVDADNVYVVPTKADSENVQSGDIIVVVRNGSKALLGKHAEVKHAMPNTVIGAFMTGIRSTHPEFVNSLLDTVQFKQELNRNMGATINQITGYMFSQMSFNIPDEQEQDRIGRLFRKLDDSIFSQRKKCEKLLEVRQSMLERLFPRPGERTPELRFAGFSGDWKLYKLSDLVSKYEDPVETPHDGYTRLGVRSFAKGTFHEYVAPGHELETAQMHRVAANKLIFNITFAWEHAVAVTDDDDAGKLVSHRFPQFSLSDNLQPEFLKYVILDERFHHHLYLSSPGGAGRNRVLKVAEALDYPLLVPSVEEQKKIGGFIAGLDNAIALHQRKLAKLQHIKQALLSKMFV